jgi:Reverse transcriptase (RNA-dependent DNA polymerase)
LHPSFTGKHTQFQRYLRKHHIVMTNSESGRHGHTYEVDITIRELRRRSRKKMITKNVPRRLWCLMLEWQARVMQLIPRGYNERTGYELVTGRTPDISEYCDFDFYDLVWYWPNTTASHTDTNRQLARWVGVAHRIGSNMCYWLMPVSGILMANTSVQHVIHDDYMNPDIKQQIDSFNEELVERLDSANFINANDTATPLDIYDIHDDDQPWEEDDTNNMPDAETLNEETMDKYIGTTFLLDPRRNENNVATRVKVLKQRTDLSGRPIGTPHINPLLDTREYICEMPDGTLDTYHANTIAENLWSQCDVDGNEFMSFKELLDHRKNEKAMHVDDGFVTENGIPKPKKTTAGWEILVAFTNGETQWLPLKIVKESNPVELAEYAIANKIDKEPAFHWWLPHTLRKRNRIIKKIKAKYWRVTHKFGIRLPKSVDEALRIDVENGNTLWRDAIEKEMAKAKISYTAVDGATPQDVRSNKCDALRGHQEIKCHIIFDVKMDFTRKARFVAGGHMTEAPSSITYSSVVSRESVKIAFLIAALNELDIMSCDIGNAYLNAPCRERIWFVAGKECGPHLEGKPCKLVRALYGLKSSGAAWRAMFSNFVTETLGFKPTRIDPDVYYRKNYRSDGSPYYEYLLIYVDDVLALSLDPTAIMKDIGKQFTIKDGKYGPPTTYLGANIEKYQLDDGSYAWSMTSKHYVKMLIETISDLLAEDGRELKGTFKQKSHTGPLSTSYKPELDSTPLCSEEHASRFRQIIGILRWAVELGRLDIHFEVSMMSQYQAEPRVGHLEALYLIVHYLKKNPFKRIVFDPRTVPVDENIFNDVADWTEFYGNVVEENPPGMPEPLGNPVTITCFVDANHATNQVTRRSHTGVMIFLNRAPTLSYSKRQNTCESSTYGSELVAMRIARDLISALRIKLKSFGIPIQGPANTYGDNGAVVKNTSIPESTLNKKHNSINYHIVRESVAARMMRIGKEDTETNIADAFTKLLHTDRKRKLLQFLKDH